MSLVVLSSMPLCAAEDPELGEPVNGLQAELVLDRAVFSTGTAIPVRAVLRNVSNQILSVFTGLIPIYNADGEILFILETLAGEPVRVIHGIDERAAPQMADFQRLEPGQSLGVRAELSPDQWQMKLGSYRLKVQLNIRANRAYEGTEFRPVEHVWTGTVVSNTVEITIHEPMP